MRWRILKRWVMIRLLILLIFDWRVDDLIDIFSKFDAIFIAFPFIFSQYIIVPMLIIKMMLMKYMMIK
jgi:hypothetical protein